MSASAGWFLAEGGLRQGGTLLGIEEGRDHAEEMKGQRPITARPPWHMDVEAAGRHQRQQPDCGRHEPVESRVEFGGREFRPGFFLQAEEGHDLRQALAEDEILAARQHRHGARAQRLQLGQAGRILEDIYGNEVDLTDR